MNIKETTPQALRSFEIRMNKDELRQLRDILNSACRGGNGLEPDEYQDAQTFIKHIAAAIA